MSDDLRAPIFTASWDLCVWILTKARAQPQDLLARELAVEALRLLDTVQRRPWVRAVLPSGGACR